MGAGTHGGFGATKGSRDISPISLSSTFVGKGEGEELKKVSTWVKEEPGFTDVIVHGTANNAQVFHNGKWVELDQRRLAKMIKKDAGYSKGAIRLLSCNSGALSHGFAQNLANKMGVTVKAPTDKLWVYPTGKMVIGQAPWKNTGSWKTYYPQKKGR